MTMPERPCVAIVRSAGFVALPALIVAAIAAVVGAVIGACQHPRVHPLDDPHAVW